MAEQLKKTVSRTPIRFADGNAFLEALRNRVDQSFDQNEMKKRDCFSMYVKTLTILAWFAASYVGLVFWASAAWQACLLATSLGLSMACIGFNIQHDGAHGAYSYRNWINRLSSMTLDMLGGSSYIWKKTHNLYHHSYTNINGHDGDIDLGGLGRLSPHQPRQAFHRFQHLYLWFLYGFVTLKWQFYDDPLGLFVGRIGDIQFARPKGQQLAIFLVGKLLFITLAFIIPFALHSWYQVLGIFFLASFVQGLVLSVVFQLAHVVEEADYPEPEQGTGQMDNAWAVHQVESTVDFARRSRIVCWFVGGLNHQIEHHLFPKICHVNYPAMSGVVESTCQEFGVRYQSHRTLFGAIASHYNMLRRLGRA